jgi:membrane protein
VVAFIRQLQRLGDAVTHRYDSAVAGARKRSGVFENFWAAKQRYADVLGGRLAAAVAYYAFFASFALTLVALSVFGYLLDRYPTVKESATETLAKTLPTFPIEPIAQNAGSIALFGLVGLVFTGLAWVDAWRSSQRAIWKLDQHPGNLVIRRLVDLGILLGLAIVLTFSLTLADLLRALFDWVTHGRPSIGNTVATGAITLLINTIIAVALLTVLPRLHVQPRRLIPPAIAVGIGLSLLNLGGRAYVAHATRFYAGYAVIATAGGLLLYLYLYNQIVLWGAALAATSARGRFTDLAAGPVPDSDGNPAPDTTENPGT